MAWRHCTTGTCSPSRLRAGTGRTRPGSAADNDQSAAVPALTDQEQALAWARAERASLLACLDYAVGTGQHARVIALTAGIGGVLLRDGPWADAIVRHTAAVQALEEALGIHRDMGDRGGEADAVNERGTLHRVSGELALAQECHQRALELSRQISSSADEAHALAGLGRCVLAAGHAAQAETLLRQALEIFQRIGAAAAPGLVAEIAALTGLRPAP